MTAEPERHDRPPAGSNPPITGADIAPGISPSEYLNRVYDAIDAADPVGPCECELCLRFTIDDLGRPVRLLPLGDEIRTAYSRWERR